MSLLDGRHCVRPKDGPKAKKDFALPNTSREPYMGMQAEKSHAQEVRIKEPLEFGTLHWLIDLGITKCHEAHSRISDRRAKSILF